MEREKREFVPNRKNLFPFSIIVSNHCLSVDFLTFDTFELQRMYQMSVGDCFDSK